MDNIYQNVNNLRDIVQRQMYDTVTALDVLTAFYVLLKRPIDYNLMDDKNFTLILETLSNVPSDVENRKFWLDTMFGTYESLSGINPTDPDWPKWLLLKANLVFNAPVCVIKGPTKLQTVCGY